MACAVNRDEVTANDPIIEANENVDNPNIKLLNFNDYICDKKKCYASIGQVPVYYDAGHLNRVFVISLQKAFAEQVDKALVE